MRLGFAGDRTARAATARQAAPTGGAIGRFFQIVFRISGYLTWLLLWRLGLVRRPSPARRFAGLLENLGTSFVKLGQHLSLRADLFPAEYLAELQKLQDKVKPFPAEESIAAIEKAFGRPVAQLFIRFDAEPFAAASVAQVHGARTFSGREVVVKVLRPGVKPQVNRDMKILAGIVRFLTHFSPVLSYYKAEDIVREVHQNLCKELDLREEGRAVRRFHDEFHDWPAIEVPDVVDDLCTETVMVVTRLFGKRIDEHGNRRRSAELAQNLIDAYVHMFFVMGYFHGDPHPGNIFVTEQCRLGLHDFGVIGSIDRTTRQALASFMLAFTEQDTDWVLDSWLELGMLSKAADRAKLRPAVAALMSDYSRRPIGEWSIGEAFAQLVTATRGQNFAVPLHLLVLARALVLVEATVRLLDPDFSVLDSLSERSREVMETALMPEQVQTQRLKYEAAVAATEWQRMLASSIRRLREEGLRFKIEPEGLPDLSNLVIQGSSRVSLALVTLGLYLAASLLMQFKSGPRVLDVPVLAAVFYLYAAWLTLRLVRAIGRGL
ncbi:MAG TPA: AarF/UbiB family protein [Usitatibacter sp.]|nr:AarF/UbiB family protein [Usitatibacter sp.]